MNFKKIVKNKFQYVIGKTQCCKVDRSIRPPWLFHDSKNHKHLAKLLSGVTASLV